MIFLLDDAVSKEAPKQFEYQSIKNTDHICPKLKALTSSTSLLQKTQNFNIFSPPVYNPVKTPLAFSGFQTGLFFQGLPQSDLTISHYSTISKEPATNLLHACVSPLAILTVQPHIK